MPTNKIPIDISDQPVAEMATYIAKSFNFRLVDPFQLQQRVTIKLREPVTAAEAIQLLDQTLLSMGYTVMREVRVDPPMLELRITSAAQQGGLPQLPVHSGADPARIPATDELRTQVISLTYTDPQKARDLIAPVLDAKADVTINTVAKTIMITDTSSRIRTAASLIQVLEKQAAEKQPAMPAR
jgi:type II secretory pathway component GspD/PulD (secretin)